MSQKEWLEKCLKDFRLNGLMPTEAETKCLFFHIENLEREQDELVMALEWLQSECRQACHYDLLEKIDETLAVVSKNGSEGT